MVDNQHIVSISLLMLWTRICKGSQSLLQLQWDPKGHWRTVRTSLVLFLMAENVGISFHFCIYLSHLCNPPFSSRTLFLTSASWHQGEARGQLWVWWVLSIRWKRKVCWTLCSTWEDFLALPGRDAHTHTHTHTHTVTDTDTHATISSTLHSLWYTMQHK